MGNPVGSYETKYWHKKLIPIKATMSISVRQREVIIGSLLGDGTMRIGKNAKNANFKIEHGLKQKELVEWKYKELKSLVLTGSRLSYRYDENREKYPKSWWFRTVRHPEMTEIYNEFYIGEGYRTGRKIVPSSITKELTPLALAVWFMDDGSNAWFVDKADVSTYSFNLAENQLLQSVLSDRYDITSEYYLDRDKGYRMIMSKEGTHRLNKIIRPYVIPSMMYKIGFVTP